MPANKYLANIAGQTTEVLGTAASAGAGDADKIVALDATGRLSSTMMPVGIAADTALIVASEALTAGDLVNVWNNAGAFNVRKADASTSGKEAHGYVLAAFASSASATVFFEGSDTQVTALTPGKQYLSATTAGRSVATAPSASGQVVQQVGFATSATVLNFQSLPSVLLA